MTLTRYWRKLKSTEFAGIDKAATVVILPLAAVEQHGPHLPLDVDLRINEGILGRVAETAPAELPFLILPPQAVGCSPEHEAFPGTLSSSPGALLENWTSIVGQAAAIGFRRFLLFNSHGGNSDLMRVAVREIRAAFDALAVAASWYRMVDMARHADADELAHGIHGGLVETSVMLRLEPDAVDMSKAEAFPSFAAELAARHRHLSATGNVQFGWMAQDLNPSGAVGDAASATAERGARILAEAADNLTELLSEIAAFDLADLHADGA